MNHNIHLHLRNALTEYMQQRPNLSLRSIAQNSGLDRYFLAKVMSEKGEGLDINKVVTLVQFLTEKKGLNSAIDSTTDELKLALKEAFQVEYEKNSNKSDLEDLDLYEFDTYFTLVFSTLPNGTTKEFVGKMLGEKAQNIMDYLIKTETIIEKNERFIFNHGMDFNTTLQIFKHHIKNYMKFYNTEHAGQGRNYIHVEVSSFNKEGLSMVQNAHRELHKKVAQIKSDSKYQGEIPFFSLSCMDTFQDKLNN